MPARWQNRSMMPRSAQIALLYPIPLTRCVQIAAGVEHSQELATLREKSLAAAEQLKNSHQTEIESLTASHQEGLDTQVKSLEKQISSLKLDLTATQDSHSKAKAALAVKTEEAESRKAQVEQVKKDTTTAHAAAISEKEVALEDVAKQLSNAQKELADLNVCRVKYILQ